jgi:hypothetical protein
MRSPDNARGFRPILDLGRDDRAGVRELGGGGEGKGNWQKYHLTAVAETLLATSLPAAFEMMAGVRKVARET